MAKWEISLFCSQNRALFKCEPAVQLSEASSCAWEPGKTVLVQLFKIYQYYSFSDKKSNWSLYKGLPESAIFAFTNHKWPNPVQQKQSHSYQPLVQCDLIIPSITASSFFQLFSGYSYMTKKPICHKITMFCAHPHWHLVLKMQQ